MKCPKCNKETTWLELSSGGDGLETCTCGWVEDPTKLPEEQL